MTKRELLDSGTRLIGLWQLANGVDELITFGNVTAKLFSPMSTSANGYLTHAVAHLFVGLLFFLRAGDIASIVYRPEKTVGIESR